MGQNSGLLSSLTDWNSTLAGYADSISSGVVMPIALTVLALFMVLELYNFTQTIWLRRLRKHVQRMDGEPRLPLLYLCRILRRHFS